MRVPNQLREATGGRAAVIVTVPPPATVETLLDALSTAHPPLGRRVRDELGRVRVHVNLFLGPDNIRDLDGLSTAVVPGAELTIIAAVSGG